jgi:hypothetical protein
MQEPIRERIEKLREEIAQISAADSLYLQSGKKPPGAADHQRRRERLQEILNELKSLTDWREP